jgi:tetratricopeptide (TPR) repeat protein
MTGQPWRSAIVAGILAVHPLHVESVAWISERKDVLCTFFEMLTLLLYIRYTERRGAWRYAWMALSYACALMAKPMAVTFPFVLLLMDVWPLRRIGRPFDSSRLRGLLLEKTPLLAMAALGSVLTFAAQRTFGAVVALTLFPFPVRAASAAVAYAQYLVKAVWPAGLGVLYPAQQPTVASTLCAVLVLGCITAAAILLFRLRPYILVGWLWYLGMLVPVIGLVQVGVQAMADRYTYLPLVGVSIALVWLIADSVTSRPAAIACTALAAGWLLVLAVVAHRQAGYWKNSRALFEQTLAVTSKNYIIENNLGVVLNREGDANSAIALFRRAIADYSDFADARANLGHALMISGKFEEAEPLLRDAERLSPQMAMPQADLGVLLAAGGKWEDARREMEIALRNSPGDADLQSNLCYVLQRLGQFDEAIASCAASLRTKPDFAEAHFNLGTALAATGRKSEAAAEFSRVLAAHPDRKDARAALEALNSR